MARHVQVHDGDGSVPPPPPEKEKRKAVTLEQLYTAIEWLNSNEGDGEEGEACRAVAKMLGDEAERREVAGLDRAIIREAMKKHGITREAAIWALRKVKQKDRLEDAQKKLGLTPLRKGDIPVSDDESV